MDCPSTSPAVVLSSVPSVCPSTSPAVVLSSMSSVFGLPLYLSSCCPVFSAICLWTAPLPLQLLSCLQCHLSMDCPSTSPAVVLSSMPSVYGLPLYLSSCCPVFNAICLWTAPLPLQLLSCLQCHVSMDCPSASPAVVRSSPMPSDCGLHLYLSSCCPVFNAICLWTAPLPLQLLPCLQCHLSVDCPSTSPAVALSLMLSMDYPYTSPAVVLSSMPSVYGLPLYLSSCCPVFNAIYGLPLYLSSCCPVFNAICLWTAPLPLQLLSGLLRYRLTVDCTSTSPAVFMSSPMPSVS